MARFPLHRGSAAATAQSRCSGGPAPRPFMPQHRQGTCREGPPRAACADRRPVAPAPPGNRPTARRHTGPAAGRARAVRCVCRGERSESTASLRSGWAAPRCARMNGDGSGTLFWNEGGFDGEPGPTVRRHEHPPAPVLLHPRNPRPAVVARGRRRQTGLRSPSRGYCFVTPRGGGGGSPSRPGLYLGGGGTKRFVAPTETNRHGDALCFTVKTRTRQNTTEALLNNG